jgi:hypothetical protein
MAELGFRQAIGTLLALDLLQQVGFSIWPCNMACSGCGFD